MHRALESSKLTARELLFRAVCRHTQGDKPNILLFCTRRSGSTWLLNTLAAHPGMRYVGRPLQAIQQSRWRRRMPDLARAGEDASGHHFQHPIHFEGDAESTFRALADDIINCRIHVYPSLNFRAPYFHRRTNRVVFQMTYGTPLIEWFDANFNVKTIVLFRHPIANALSVMREGWPPECEDFLRHKWFRETQLSSGTGVSSVSDSGTGVSPVIASSPSTGDEAIRACNGADRLALAQRIMTHGTLFEKHVLDWCLKMLIPFQAIQSGKHPDWIVLSYERIVLEPEAVVRELSAKLDLPDVEAMLAQVRRPSRTVTGATAEHVHDPKYLLNRWRERLSTEQQRSLMAIVSAFGIDAYADANAAFAHPHRIFGP